MKKHLGILGLLLALGAVVTLAVGMTVWAQAPSPTPSTPQQQQPKGVWPGGRGMHRGFGSSEEFAAIAKALNMTTDELTTQLRSGKTLAELAQGAGVDLQTVYDAAQTARVAAQKADIEAAVQSGNLTREQADWMIEGLDKGYGLGFGRGMLGFGGFGVAQAERAAIAQALKMTPEQLTVQRWGGRTLADLATAAGVSLDDVYNAAKAARVQSLTDQINRAVSAGTISQDQGNWLLRGVQNGYLDKGAHGLGGFPGGMRGGLGGRGMRGPFNGAPNRGTSPSIGDAV